MGGVSSRHQKTRTRRDGPAAKKLLTCEYAAAVLRREIGMSGHEFGNHPDTLAAREE
jgi:hypothetical protein